MRFVAWEDFAEFFFSHDDGFPRGRYCLLLDIPDG